MIQFRLRADPGGGRELFMLEKMGAFFDNRLETYDMHMMKNIDSADAFYPFTAELLPKEPGARVLDLGCGTGLELAPYFQINPSAKIVGIDLAPGMLGELKRKFPGRDLHLILGSYFDAPFGEQCFDAAVSVESLHHFTSAEKLPLYRKLWASLRERGYFVLTDYFALSDAEEKDFRENFLRYKAEQGIEDDELYHFDTPLTVAHECEVLSMAGFSKIEVLSSWGATHTIKARK